MTPDTVIAVPPTGATVRAVASSSSSSIILSGLVKQKAYSITVHGAGGASSEIVWATADRYTSIRLYETADPNTSHPNGLCLTPGNVTAYSVAASKPFQDSIDIVFATDPTVPGTFITLESAGVTGSGVPFGKRSVAVADASYLIKGGLDSDYYSSDFSGLFIKGYQAVDFSGPAAAKQIGGGDFVIDILTSSGHYARLSIQRQADGYLFTTDGSGRHAIDVVVSLQSGNSAFPYASRGFQAPTTHQKRSGGSIVIAN